MAAAICGVLSTGAHALDWSGYFRAGPGQKTSTAGDTARCFGAGFAGGTYRLGNECDTYGEFALSQGGKAGNVEYKALLMTNFYRPGSDVGDEKVGVNQIYAQGKGFDIAPNQTFWIGKRFYGRADVHMVDTFFVNMSGTGGGVDGIALGSVSMNAAVFRDGDNTTNPGTRVNLDFVGLPVNPGGKLRLTATFTDFSGAGGETGNGLSLQHNQSGVLGGDNTLWLQYAQGSAGLNMNFGTGTAGSDVKGWRIVESLQWVTGPLTGQALALVGKQGASGSKQSFNTVGGRVAYAFTQNFKLQGELGVSSIKPQGGTTQRLTKLTVAPTLTVGTGYYDRPELRLYVSSFSFNDAYQAANGLTKSSRTAAGLQVEMWF